MIADPDQAGAKRPSRPIISGLFSAGFAAAMVCCALATWLALNAEVGPASGPLLFFIIGALVLTIMLAGLAAARLIRVLFRHASGAPTPRLHLRFVALFSFAAVAPAILMAAFFGVLLSRGLETWFGDTVETAVESAVETGDFYLREIVDQARLDVLTTAADLAENVPEEVRADPRANSESLEAYLAEQSAVRAFKAAYIVSAADDILVAYESDVADPYQPPLAEDLVESTGGVQVYVDQQARALRLGTLLEGYDGAHFYAVPDVNLALFDQLSSTAEATATFNDARAQRDRIETFFVLIYFVAALLILSGSVWLALSAAGRVAGPVGRLVEAADRVRKGDLAARVEEDGEHDEVSALGRAFNLMTGQIARQRQELVDANAKSEERRRLIEAVLLGVSAGVLSVDEDGLVRLANWSAAELLGAEQGALLNRPLAEVAPALAEIVLRARARPGDTVEQEVELTRGAAALVLNVRAAVDEESDGRRVVLTFDDITRLIAAQRNAAWRDVARRIAHEIKNPLTPIQLSAERLRRRYRPADDQAADIFDRCTDTIIRQVSDIGRMVDEFSAFARMPTPRIENATLQDLAQETVFARRVASPDVRVSLDAPEAPVAVQCDARLASQALANILKNAAESISDRREQGDARPGRIDVRVRAEGASGVVEIQDNGLGWPSGARERLTEPYMTTREKGTGLGLAIVQRIMEDHGGRLELDTPGDGARGALVRLAFPLAGRTQREKGQSVEAAE